MSKTQKPRSKKRSLPSKGKRAGKAKVKAKSDAPLSRVVERTPVAVLDALLGSGVIHTGRRGRPRVVDPRVSTHIQLTATQRELCNRAATSRGLAFAAWSRMVLLETAKGVLAANPGVSPAPG